MERDLRATDHLLFFYMPDLLERPLRLIPNLVITPLVNTETDQLMLVTALILVFGTLVERRLGLVVALAVFWGTSAVAAIGGAALFHLVEPLAPAFRPIASAGERVFNGASAGGYGLLAAFASTTARPWIWVGLFGAWESAVWWLGGALEYTPVFHVLAIGTGMLMPRVCFPARLRAFRQSARRGAAG
jgi:hypothetical protein